MAGAVVLMLGIVLGLLVAPSVRDGLTARHRVETAWQQRVEQLSSACKPWWYVGRHARLLLDCGAVLVVTGGIIAFVASGADAMVGGASATVGLFMAGIGELTRHWSSGQPIDPNRRPV